MISLRAFTMMVLASLTSVSIPICTAGSDSVSGGAPLYVVPEGVETRWASRENIKGEKGTAAQANAGRKGSPCFTLKSGQSEVLAEATGTSGTIRRIWITISDRSPRMLRGVRLDFFWDGAEKAAVSAPLGDLFCQGLGRTIRFQNVLFSNPEGRSFNCVVPMPFKESMKIVATNETDTDLPGFFYDVDYTLGDPHGEDVLYFHAFFNRQNPTTLKEDYEILPRVKGRGRFLGTLLGVIPDDETYFRSWWGEGEVKVYLDGDEEFPTLSGTGTEDYIGTAWGQGQYDNLYQGSHLADSGRFQFCFYRLHVPDPVYFHEDIRVTIQQIGHGNEQIRTQFRDAGRTIYRAGRGMKEVDLTGAGKVGLFERQDDWSSCAYFYLDCPENDLPPLPPLEERIAGLE